MSARDGNFVTATRIRHYSLMLLAMSLLTYGYLIATSTGVMDRFHRPVGTDFSNIYAAGTFVNDGNPTAPFTPALQEQRERDLFGPDTQFYGWHYPPFFLTLAGLLAALPYACALGAWLLATGALYLRSIQKLLPQHSVWLPALAYPAVFVNLGHGHNGFLTAGLIGFALLWLKPKPILAGICIGLLAYKPQFGLLIPVALLAGRHYRVFAAATLTVLAMAALATALYGVEVWHAFTASLPFTREVVLEQGQTGFAKIQSLFAAMRLWGTSIAFAYGAQLGLTLWLGKTLWHLWRSPVADEMKYAALILACFLATPYSLDYDLMVLAPAIALLIRHGLRAGFGPYEKSLLAITFLLPLFARALAQYALLPLTPFLLLMLYQSTMRSSIISRYRP